MAHRPLRAPVAGASIMLAALFVACAAPSSDRAPANVASGAGASAAASATLAADARPAADTVRPDAAATSRPTITVYKSPTCGCCTKWVEYLQAHGYTVATHDTEDMQTVKAANGVPARLHSCHTALVGGYVIEGHVPAQTIDRLLRERPRVAGIAVPGMPAGSPGMEVGVTEAYDVVAYEAGGASRVYESH